MKSIVLCAAPLLLGLLLSAALSNGSDELEEQVELNKKHGFFNFKEFKSMYSRHYSSLVEEINREKIFMKNLFRSYISKAKYKTKNADKYLAVNDFSDRNDAELDATLIKPKILYADIEDMVPDESVQKETKSSWISDFKKKLTKAMEEFENSVDVFINNSKNFMTQIGVKMPERRQDLPDEIFIDHRKSNCLNTVRNQGQCGSCSIFSTTALYEWAYCKINGRKIRFSEQYPIDCGRKLTGLYGCNGNSPKDVAGFARNFGFELLHEYAYEAKNNQCPFEMKDKQPKEEMGAIKMAEEKRPGVKYIAFKEIESYLKIAPVLMSIRMSHDAHFYGGGLDDGAGCEKVAGFHSMLVVGSGRQDGYEYWIFRNSYSTRWGENGYYRLKKKNNCYMLWANGLTLDSIDPKQSSFEELKNKVEPLTRLNSSTAPKFVEFVENPNHDKSLIETKRRRSTLGQVLLNLE